MEQPRAGKCMGTLTHIHTHTPPLPLFGRKCIGIRKYGRPLSSMHFLLTILPTAAAPPTQFPQRRPSELSNKRLSKKNKTVNRAYGGNLSHGVVRER